MTFTEAIATAGTVTDVHVSRYTYTRILLDLDHPRINTTTPVASRLMANFSGINIHVSALVSDGQMTLFDRGEWLGTVPLEATPAKSANLIDRIKQIKPDPDRAGVWCGRRSTRTESSCGTSLRKVPVSSPS